MGGAFGGVLRVRNGEGRGGPRLAHARLECRRQAALARRDAGEAGRVTAGDPCHPFDHLRQQGLARRARDTAWELAHLGKERRAESGRLCSAPSGGGASGSQGDSDPPGPSSSSRLGAAGRQRGPSPGKRPFRRLSFWRMRKKTVQVPPKTRTPMPADSGGVVESHIADGKRCRLRRAQADRPCEDRGKSTLAVCHAILA